MKLDDIRTRLNSLESVTEVVDPDSVFVIRLPQHNKLERYVLLRKLGGSPQYELAGETGQRQTLVEVVCYAKEPNGYEQVTQMVDTVRNALSGFHSGLFGNTYIQSCTLENEPIENYEPADDGSDNGFYIVNMVFSVWHTSSIPTLN